MNTRLLMIAAAVFSLAACSETPAPTEPAAASAATASAPATDTASAASAPAAAAIDPASIPAECNIAVETSDQMKYNVNEIAVKKSCAAVKITLKHTGTMPKTSMGHNIVITKSGDASAVASAGTGAGAEAGFLKTPDERILAHTDMIGGGESTIAVLDTSKLNPNESYRFFCTFPAHFAMMQGDVKLVD